MYIFISVLILIVSVLLVLVVLVQNSKGGGLAANFAGQNQVMGVRQTADFLEKATWGLAIALVVLTLASSLVIPRNIVSGPMDTELREQIEDTPDANAVPFNPAPPRNE